MVDDFAEARKPTSWLKIDFGDLAIGRSRAQIKDPDRQDCLLGKPFLGALNFAPKMAANFFSAVLTTGPGEAVTVHPERKVLDWGKAWLTRA